MNAGTISFLFGLCAVTWATAADAQPRRVPANDDPIRPSTAPAAPAANAPSAAPAPRPARAPLASACQPRSDDDAAMRERIAKLCDPNFSGAIARPGDADGSDRVAGYQAFGRGLSYYLGLGVPRDEAAALSFFRLAAARGNQPSRDLVAYYEQNGRLPPFTFTPRRPK